MVLSSDRYGLCEGAILSRLVTLGCGDVTQGPGPSTLPSPRHTHTGAEPQLSCCHVALGQSTSTCAVMTWTGNTG